MKQWWTFWYRRNSAQALQARDQFGQDVRAFEQRQAGHPELIAGLLPQRASLQPDDWRVLLVQELEKKARHDEPNG